MPIPLTIDVETTTSNKGNPFDRKNRLVMWGCKKGDGPVEISTQGVNSAWVEEFYDHVLVGFNIKFDLHWLRIYGIEGALPFHYVWDCQLAHFLLSGQQDKFPSLNQVLEHYGLPLKLDTVKTEYWDKGINTDAIPQEILEEYLTRDIEATYEVFQHQLKEFSRRENALLYKTFKLQCEDLLTLEEMEYNGLRFARDRSLELADQEQTKIEGIKEELYKIVPDRHILWSSGDQVSVILFGGRIPFTVRERVEQPCVDGSIRVRERNATRYTTYPGYFKPARGTEGHATKSLSEIELQELNQRRSKEKKCPLQRIYSCDAQVLELLRTRSGGNKDGKRIVELLLELREAQKILSTYYEGLPLKQDEMNWDRNYLHGQFNQCAVVTGRLSSSNPNLQNLSGKTKELYVTRY